MPRFLARQARQTRARQGALLLHAVPALGARRIVEAGTSFGVSTLYLAAAVRDNGGGIVIATEYETAKAKIARGHFAEAGLSECVDLREGDLRETLKTLEGPIDFMLTDIWTPLARCRLPAKRWSNRGKRNFRPNNLYFINDFMSAPRAAHLL